MDWNGFVDKNKEYNEQDILYIFEATKLIDKLLDDKLKDKNDITAFREYLLDNVMILQNSIEMEISTEDIFANLNGNKVELSNSELLKGLFLTYAARNKNMINKENYKEIRGIMGRQWDEVSYWAN